MDDAGTPADDARMPADDARTPTDDAHTTTDDVRVSPGVVVVEIRQLSPVLPGAPP